MRRRARASFAKRDYPMPVAVMIHNPTAAQLDAFIAAFERFEPLRSITFRDEGWLILES